MRIVLLFIAIPMAALAAPAHHGTPTPTPSPKGVIEKQGLVCRTKQQDLELRDWINGLIGEVHKAQSDAKSAQDSNATTQVQLMASVKAATDLANECAADKACAKSPLSCWFHRLLKHILWVIVGLVVVALIVTIIAPGIVPIVTSFFGFIWSWIAAIFKPKTKV